MPVSMINSVMASPKRYVYRDGQGVLNHQDVEFEPGVKLLNLLFQFFFDLLNAPAEIGIAALAHKKQILDFLYIGMLEMGQRHQVRNRRIGVQFPAM